MTARRFLHRWSLTLGSTRRVPPFLAIPGIFAMSTGACFAQASSGVTGTVTDNSGAVVAGATVEVRDIGTGTVNRLVSNSAGTYAADGLSPGRYTITVTAPGFNKAIRDQVNIEVSVKSTIDVALTTGSSETTVEVTTPLIALNTTTPELGTTIEPAVVAALPVAIGGGRGRSIDSLQFLAPGTTGSTFSHRVNGGADFEEEILYNGIPAPQSETAGYSSNFNPPFELIDQFRVERSTFSANFGLAQGAVVYHTASGTNHLHGDVFYINRNEFFDAKGFFNSTVPINRQNNYGFTVGGPAVIPHLYNGKDRTFFMFALDFAKQAQTNTGIGSVPTILEKGGDFTDFVDGKGNLIPIFDPATGQQFQFQGRLNVIDPARFSALSKSILPLIPDPNRPGVLNNKSATPNAFPSVDHNIGFSIDHNLNTTQSLHYAQWRNSYTSTGFDNAPIVPTSSLLQSAKFFPTLGSVYLLNYVNAVTPRLVATAGISWIGEINNQLNVKQGGVNFPGVTSNPISNIFPAITFDGTNNPTSYGTAGGWTTSINRKLGLAVVNNWLWTAGKNTFNIGGEMRRSYQDDNECQACGGQFNFSQRTTANPAAVATTGSSFASFLIGQVDNANRIFANELSLRNLLIAPYIQDDVKFTPKLTVNVGLRWDIMLPFVEKKDQIVFLNQTAANPLAGNLPGTATRFGTSSGITRADIHYKNFGPRLGFAYQLNEKTVLQAGYNLAFLNGGAYEYGTSKVATSYGNLLQGVFTANSTGGVAPGYGSWDARALPAPAPPPFGAATGLGTTIRAFDPKQSGRAPYISQWNFNVQRQLPWNTFLQVAYVGNHAVHLDGQLNPISQPDPSILQYGSLLQRQFNKASDAAVLTAAGFKAPYANFANDLGGSSTLAHALSPFPQYGNIYNNFDLTGAAGYNALQTTLEKRFSNGLSFLTSYTLSKSVGNVDSGFATFAGLPLNKYNQSAEYTVTSADVTHNLKVSGTYELPIGPGKAFLNNRGVAGQIVGGLQVGFVLTYLSGTPIGIAENGNPLGCAGCYNRPNVIPGVAHKVSYRHLGVTRTSGSTRSAFTTTAFADTSTFQLGNAIRYYSDLRNPGYANEDIKASKKFALGEHANFLLEMNYFNIFNRTTFNGPNTNLDNNFGIVNTGQANGPRQGQLSGKVSF